MISLWLAAAPALAQVVTTGPFSGTYTENFDARPQSTVATECIEDAFGGVARICSEGTVGGMQIRPSLFLASGCTINARSVPHLAASNDGATEIRFDAGMKKVGGYFGTHVSGGELTVLLYGSDNTELLRETISFGGTCAWSWRGYSSEAPIARMRLVHTTRNAFVDLDDLVAVPMNPDDLDADGSPASADCDDLDRSRTPAATEVCDGVDNDCDGSIPADEIDGDSDGALACADCDDSDATRHPGAADLCDGVDDDCDGVDGNTDDEAPLAAKQAGVCKFSEQACGPSGWTEPDYTAIDGYEDREASCDGRDNDCDGSTDETLTAPYVDDATGVCADLRLTCEGFDGWVDNNDRRSVDDYEAVEISCDGLDNDCNGLVDDIGAPPPADKVNGVCAGAAKECVDGAWQEPDYSAIEGYSTEELCDGDLDNDCDGTVMTRCPPAALCGCTSTPASTPAWGLILALSAFRRRSRAR
jgi:MYXO-CTERM domain-containing protein